MASMSIRRIALAGAATGLTLGVVATLERWSDAHVQSAIAIATVIGGLVFVALPEELRRRRH
jgi:hypothetical protein